MRVHDLTDPPRKYAVIYADPAWSFKVWSRDTGMGRSAEAHYGTMGADDLKALPVAGLAADDCALLMWTSPPLIPQALDLGAAWGFTYKTFAFDWAKQTTNGHWHIGMGYWTRANTEQCLLFVRGKPRRKSKAVRALQIHQVGRHSAKPLAIYNEIERLLDGPYIELFGRRHKPGWDVWGNEAPEQAEAWQAPLAL